MNLKAEPGMAIRWHNTFNRVTYTALALERNVWITTNNQDYGIIYHDTDDLEWFIGDDSWVEL